MVDLGGQGTGGVGASSSSEKRPNESPSVESLGLDECPPKDTYLDDESAARVWIGSKWDVCEFTYGGFGVYRKGNYVLTVGSLDLALQIIADDGGFGG